MMLLKKVLLFIIKGETNPFNRDVFVIVVFSFDVLRLVKNISSVIYLFQEGTVFLNLSLLVRRCVISGNVFLTLSVII